nr:MAG TPA: hypothetical protein [Caudoviricetes sp.]
MAKLTLALVIIFAPYGIDSRVKKCPPKRANNLRNQLKLHKF